MISTAEALAKVLALMAPLPVEEVALRRAAGRVLARPLAARMDQPPFATAAMDGYALGPVAGDSFIIIGEAAAGKRFSGALRPGEAVRIFTGAPMPEGAESLVIQEDTRTEGGVLYLTKALPAPGANIRPAGTDFRKGEALSAPRRLGPRDVALLAAMNHGLVPVTRRPDIAIIATGDELVMPGEAPGPDQICASNVFGLAAMAEARGAEARLLPIARDTPETLRAVLDLARGADLIVTVGGASVGDHDLVGQVAAEMGLERAFYKVAMRPGKPLMAGRLHGKPMLGLPGNPVSAMVCGVLFMLPAIDALLGLPAGPAPRETGILDGPLPANGPREHFMRARIVDEGGARARLAPAASQDSALLGVLARADALIVRAPGDPACDAGTRVPFLRL